MLLDELNAQRDAIAALGRRYGARRIRVFGSVARRQETAGTDIDLLVDLPLPVASSRQRTLPSAVGLLWDASGSARKRDRQSEFALLDRYLFFQALALLLFVVITHHTIPAIWVKALLPPVSA